MSNEIKTFEEAKQKVAENLNYKSIKDVILSSWIVEDLEGHIDSVYNEAANLWQQSNIAEIEEWKAQARHSSKLHAKCQAELLKTKAKDKSNLDRIKELEEGLRKIYNRIEAMSAKRALSNVEKDTLANLKELLNKTT